MKILYIYILLILSMTSFSCDGRKAELISVERDTSITKVNAATKLVLDSTRLERFISELKTNDTILREIRNFYNGRNFQLAWFTEDGVAEQAQFFWAINDEYLRLTKDSSFYDPKLQEAIDTLSDASAIENLNNDEIINLELQTSLQFFEYANSAYIGRLHPKELQWHIPKKKLDLVTLLDSLLKTGNEDITDWEPVNPQYRSLKEQLLRLYSIEKSYPREQISLITRSLRVGDSSAIIGDIKHRLKMMGDYKPMNMSNSFDAKLEAGVRNMQKRFGLRSDGVVGRKTVEALNIPVEDIIRKVLINMERFRWLSTPSPGRRIVVNIPEFKARVYEGNSEALSMNIVVGKAATRTVIFSDELKYIVFSPYWNVPSSIVRREILPAMKRTPAYLQKHNMEITGTENGLPIIRQKPGKNNSLGKVKFLFPNKYNIYLHDTPAKTLFNENRRAFSHGCIRVSKPYDLAEYLLKDKPGWPPAKIKQEMNRSAESWVTLKETVPVLITYFTAWVDDDGHLQLRDDIYGHDKRMEKRLFLEDAHMLAAGNNG